MTESQTTHQNEGKLKTVVDLISNAIQPWLEIWEQFNFQEEDQGNQAKDYWEIDPELILKLTRNLLIFNKTIQLGDGEKMV